jgi:hypothetical protein
MANEKPQNFGNHVRLVPGNIVGTLILIVSLGGKLYALRHGISFGSIMDVLVMASLVVLFIVARASTLTVQDRLIRLEMRLRLAHVLPADLQSRIPEFTVDQLVALRFASDSELPALARKVLDEKIANRTAIKKLVQNWQGDYLRA